MSKSLKWLAGSFIVTSLLVACNKTEEPKPETPKTEVVALPVADDSPTVGIWTEGMKLGTTLMLLEQNPQLSDTQKACLLGDEANATYLAGSKAEMLRVLGEDGIKQADEFYRSELGKKVAEYSRQQMKIAAGEKVENPISLTDDEQAKVMEFMNSEIMKKMQENIAQVSAEKMEADLAVIAKQEAVRCQVPNSDVKTSTPNQPTSSSDKK